MRAELRYAEAEPQWRGIWSRSVNYRKAELAQARRRDELQAQRPEGCGCLGAGDIGAEFCRCPEGIAAAAEQAQTEAQLRAADIRSWMLNSGLPKRFAACSFDSYPGPRASADLMRKHAEAGQFSLFLWGPFGTGKTGLASAMLRDRVQRLFEPAYFVTVPTLLQEIRSTYNRGADAPPPSPVGDRARSTRFLVLDDIGAERVTEWVSEQLFTLINHRHDQELDTLFTSNLSPEELAARIGERTVWRIMEMCEVQRLDGPNLRQRP